MAGKSFDLDQIWPKIGEFGKYQKLLLWLVCLPACFPGALSALNQLFMAATPGFRCKSDNATTCTTANRSNGCEEWEFDQSGGVRSVVTDFGLICDKDIYPVIGLAVLNAGSCLGVYHFGRLNDSIGRRKSFFTALTVMLIGNIITASAGNFYWWVAGRFVVGLTQPALFQIPLILTMEIVGSPYRIFVTVLATASYISGLITLAILAYFIRNWIHLTLVTSLPFALFYFYWLVFPESPRWLLAQGRYDEAIKQLKLIAKINGKQFDFNPIIATGNNKENFERRKSKKRRFLSLCAFPNMRLKAFLITLNWFMCQNVYLGLSYYGPSLGSNEYLSFLLSSVVELPSILFCYLVMDKWGRRWPLCLCTIFSGITCIATVLLPSDSENAILVMFLIAKFTISASFFIMYPFAAEVFPTEIRGIGIGTATYFSTIGTVIIPFVVYLGTENLILPLLILGSLSIIGGLSSLRLPETLHHPLPETLEEGEKFGKNFTLQDCLRCVPLKAIESDED